MCGRRAGAEGEAGDGRHVQAGPRWERQGEAEESSALAVGDPGSSVWMEGRLPAQQLAAQEVQGASCLSPLPLGPKIPTVISAFLLVLSDFFLSSKFGV